MRKITKTILATMVCFLPLFLFLVQIPSASAAAGWQVGYNLARDGSALPENQVQVVVFVLLQWLLLIFTFICVIAFVLAGMMFLTTGGDAQQAATAKKYVQYAMIGVAVGISGYVVITFVSTLMSGLVQTEG